MVLCARGAGDGVELRVGTFANWRIGEIVNRCRKVISTSCFMRRDEA